MPTQTIYFFPSSDSAEISQVGGKGYSLMLGSHAGLPVPPGFILSVDYFSPWFNDLKKTAIWKTFFTSQKHNEEKVCTAVKHYALQLAFTEQQEKELTEALSRYDKTSVFAVRSSSPEEDLEGASFAGGYETVLGVHHKNIKQAIKKAFASCLDYRVFVYKRENGFDVAAPKISVIIQEQIPSDIAGVGFSLNPLTNNYDEAVFTANWGLGETVVSGVVTPDTYAVNKVDLKITDKKLGKKERSLYLTPNGTEEKRDGRAGEHTLTDDQLIALTKLIKQVEDLYKTPIDIEWAYWQEKLYLLQARPITTYIPLPDSMITTPGARKRLYVDATTTIQGIYQPLSITGTSFFLIAMKKVGKFVFFRDITSDINLTIPWITPGKIYGNLSNLLKILGKKKLINFITIIDPLTAKAIESCNEKEYQSSANKLQLLPIGLLAKFPKIVSRILRARRNPEATHKKIQQQLQIFLNKAQRLSQQENSLVVLTNTLFLMLLTDVFLHTVPLFIAGKLALKEMKKIAGKELESEFAPLEVALPHNVTTEMGLFLYAVSELLPKNLTGKKIKEGIVQKTLPEAFLNAWNKFLTKYGHRGPREIDVAAPRYLDNPELLINLLLSMKSYDSNDNPVVKFRAKQEAAQKAYEHLFSEIAKKDKAKAQRFQKHYKVFHTFAGYRESHKYYLTYVTYLIRKKIVEEGKSFYKNSRLQSVEEVFDVTLQEIDTAKKDATFDLIGQAKKNRKIIDKISHITSPPSLFDSRGLIIRPPAQKVQKGEMAGTPISSGVARGKIKVLHTPTEKQFLKGEILVARATDPGWTPLFANAAAVILEIGGVLQHGALVAREYGLPCVAGVENATEIWKDGTLVEVDGSTGIIKIVSDK